MRYRLPATCLLAAAAALAGCEAREIAPPPVSLAEYSNPQRRNAEAYPDRTVVLHNLSRAMDPQLSEGERAASMELVARLGGDDAAVREQLAAILTDPEAPASLSRQVLKLLLERDYPDLAAHVVTVLPRLDAESGLKEQVLEWLARHPTPAVLAEIVKLWAKEPTTGGPDEMRYRQVVQRLTGRPWDQALLDSLNADSFLARGSAVEVLAGRLGAAELGRRVAEIPARSDAIRAMQDFLTRFNYLPTTGEALLQCVWLCRTQPAMLADAARLAEEWHASSGYRFDVRDFHLLSRLGRDPLHKNLRRSQLILELAQGDLKRSHVPRRIASAYGGVYDFSDRLSRHVESLSMGDLWKLKLLTEMLSRPHEQTAMRMTADRDRADRAGAWGGLVFYENGQAEARLYPQDYKSRTDDLAYVPTSEAIQALRDSLCLFHCHFENADNAERAGPTADELRGARRGDYCGLVLTSVSRNSFCAHYYNPAGEVVSLGEFPFR